MKVFGKVPYNTKDSNYKYCRKIIRTRKLEVSYSIPFADAVATAASTDTENLAVLS